MLKLNTCTSKEFVTLGYEDFDSVGIFQDFYTLAIFCKSYSN